MAAARTPHAVRADIRPGMNFEITTRETGMHGTSHIYTTGTSWTNATVVKAGGQTVPVDPSLIAVPHKMRVVVHGVPGSAIVVGGIRNTPAGQVLDASLVKHELPDGAVQLTHLDFPHGPIQYLDKDGCFDREFDLNTKDLLGPLKAHREATYVHEPALRDAESKRVTKKNEEIYSVEPDSHIAGFLQDTLKISPTLNKATGKQELKYSPAQRATLVQAMGGHNSAKDDVVTHFGVVLQHEPAVEPRITLHLSEHSAVHHSPEDTDHISAGPQVKLDLHPATASMGGHGHKKEDDDDDEDAVNGEEDDDDA